MRELGWPPKTRSEECDPKTLSGVAMPTTAEVIGMNILGHTGLTVAAVFAAGYLFDTLSAHRNRAESRNPQAGRSLFTRFHAVPRSVQHLRIDYRVILLGSLLPDIIDKPLGFWLLPEVVNYSTRSVGHTLVFNVGLLAVALLFLGLTHSYRPFILAVASSSHLILDAMWQVPSRLLWPIYGWSFPLGTTTLDEWLHFQFSGGWLDAAEMAGFMALIWFGVQLYRQRSVLQFLRVGAIG